MSRVRTAAIGALTTCVATLVVPAAAIAVESTPQSMIVSAVPASYTPDVTDGTVYSIAQTGSTVVIGGDFTSIAPHGSSNSVSAQGAAAFTAATGALVSGFKPTINGTVKSVLGGPTSGTVYIGGEFSTIDGKTTSLALLSASTGSIASGWTSPSFNGDVSSAVLAGGRLFVGGNFTTVGGHSHVGMVALNPTTGAILDYSLPAFTGHHNFGVHCTGSTTTCAEGPTGVKAMDVSPDGKTMVAIGNFTDVSGADRDQIVMLNVGSSGITVDTSWASDAYTSGCYSQAFDSYVRDVQFSPDGSYFIVAATGAGGQVKNSDKTQSNCDASSRFDTDDTGPDVLPTWVDHTGNDTFLSVAVTGTAIYLGGHERWVNNSTGVDSPKEGAVPRPGIVALDPVNGLPYKWNPGRNPRGTGAWALLATSDGLYVGSDTNYIGNRLYLHEKLAFFPLTGGYKPASNSAYSLPGDVVMLAPPASASGATEVAWDGSSTPTNPAPVGVVDWSDVRGAFEINNTVYYGTADGGFFRRSFNGKDFGPAIANDPYDDPTWDNVQTGSGQTYRGVESNFYAEIPSVTSMFYSGGRVFYTLAGETALYWRWFEPDSGTMGSIEFAAASSVDWSTTVGAFLSGSNLYYADSTTGSLDRIAFNGDGTTGTATTVDSSIDWRSKGDFVAAATQSVTDEPPLAEFTDVCKDVICGFTSSGSSDPDGTITNYSWDWGDGTTTAHSTKDPVFHTFPNRGKYVVTLTVTDNDGMQASTSRRVVAKLPPHPTLVGAHVVQGDKKSLALAVPGGVSKGDLLILCVSSSSSDHGSDLPSKWTEVGTKRDHGLTTAIYTRAAHASVAGKSLKVKFGVKTKAAVTIAAYSGAAATVEASAFGSDPSTQSHTSPMVDDLAAGTLVLTYWSDRANTHVHWTKPTGVPVRAKIGTPHDGGIGSLLVDSHRAAIGSYGGLAAQTSKPTKTDVEATIALAPQRP